MSGSTSSWRQQLLRKMPIDRAVQEASAFDRETDGAVDEGPRLQRSIGVIPLAGLGVGATVGTGIFFVLAQAVPDAGPAVVVAFLLAGLAAGLAALSYAEMASTVPVAGSTYSYAYVTLGEVVAMGVAACLLLEYGVSTAAVSVGWSGYLNAALVNLTGVSLPRELLAGPLDVDPGIINLPAVVLVTACALLLVRGVSESTTVNTVLVFLKLGVLAMFVIVAFTGFQLDRFADFAPFGASGVTAAAGTIFFSFVGLDAVSTAGDEVRDPQRTMPRAILLALATVVVVYVLVAIAAVGAQPWQDFAAQSDAGLADILEVVTGATFWGTVLAIGAVVSIFSVTLVTMYGQTRILYAMGRDGMVPKLFARVSPRTRTPVANTVVVAVAVGLLAAFVPLDALWDLVSRGTLTAFVVVSLGVIILRRTMPELPRGFRVPWYPITPMLAIVACLVLAFSLPAITWLFFGIWVAAALVFYWCYGRRHAVLSTRGADDRR